MPAAMEGAHKTSMLQDVELGRSLEIEALIGAVLELGKLTGTPTPYISAIYAAVKLLGRTMRDPGRYLSVRAGTGASSAASPTRRRPSPVPA